MSVEKILTIDVGNTATKIGCFIAGELVATESIATDKSDTAFYLEELQESLAEGPLSDISGIVISCVVPELTPLFESVFAALKVTDKVVWVNWEWAAQQKGDIDFSCYEGFLGGDRIANALAGRERRYNQNIMVCSFGTAATFDMVSDEGLYMGGAIAPGFSAFLESLHVSVPSLPAIEESTKPPAQTPGFSTQACLQNGFYYGYKGLVLEVLGNLLQSAGWPLSQVGFLFTGGDAETVQAMVSVEIPNSQLESSLTLWGLYQARATAQTTLVV